MTQLRRLAVGTFCVADAITVETLTKDRIRQVLRPAIDLVTHFRRRQLSATEVTAIRRGQSIATEPEQFLSRPSDLTSVASQKFDARVALVQSEDVMIGIGEMDVTSQRIHPRIVFPD